MVLLIGVALATLDSVAFAAQVESRAEQAPADEALAATRAAMGHANDLLERDASAALAEFVAAIRSRGFARLPMDDQYKALASIGQIAADLGDNQTAYELLKSACGYARADDLVWHRRLAVAFTLKDFADAAMCVTVIAHNWPQTLDRINANAIYSIANTIQSKSLAGRGDAKLAARHFELLSSLYAANWTEDGVQPSWAWLDLIDAQLARSQLEKAKAVAARIDSPRMRLLLLIDKRYDRITRDMPQALDLQQTANAYVAGLTARADASTDHLSPRVDLQYVLMDALQPKQALAISDAVIEKVADADGSKIYADFKDYYIWILDNRALALQRLGRWDDAVAQQRKAARRPERGELNVSQALNLGILYANLGRDEEALDAVSELGELSSYGRMQRELVELMTAVHRNDQASVKKHLAFMREHRAEGVS
jgi:tetratricopeptide (TPR) repeat protein